MSGLTCVSSIEIGRRVVSNVVIVTQQFNVVLLLLVFWIIPMSMTLSSVIIKTDAKTGSLSRVQAMTLMIFIKKIFLAFANVCAQLFYFYTGTESLVCEQYQLCNLLHKYLQLLLFLKDSQPFLRKLSIITLLVELQWSIGPIGLWQYFCLEALN